MGLLARLKQRAEASVGARGGVQLGIVITQTERMGQAAASPRAPAPHSGAFLPPIRGGYSVRNNRSLPRTTFGIPILRGQLVRSPKLVIQKCGFRHGLLGCMETPATSGH